MDLPAEEVPSELPEPCLGINFARYVAPRRVLLRSSYCHTYMIRYAGRVRADHHALSRRDGMQKKDWLRLVAAHSDAWLYSVAFYYGAKLKQHER